ncbi:autotransporter assembly complex protein TamA [Tateyamaria pelophila]|uniref:autotransporter assembly complex protein TamA n=1 Tax=Tateyamaria pelophila TaxID=328415 RepID=UPI001CBF7B40|nr:BamA/TamA family outer membrane protein [Tateyamaria pelophila]
MKRSICRFLAVLAVTGAGIGPVGAFELEVSAQDENLADRIRAASLLSTLQPEDEGAEQPSSIEVLSAAQAEYRRTIGLLYDAGFFAPEISILVDGKEAALISPVSAPNQIKKVEIIVQPGNRFTFGTVGIGPKSQLAEPVEGFESGQTARVSAMRAATAAQIEGWRQDGHAKARVADQEITARHTNSTLDAIVTLDPGPRLRFGNLYIEGQSKVPEARLQEIAGWPSGDVFDPDTLRKVQTRLRRTGTFSTSNLTEAEVANPDGTLDVTATINDQLPRRYTFGAEYGTDEGLTLEGSWLHRNIFGNAERLLIEGSFGGIGSNNTSTSGLDYLLSARLSRPATFATDLEAYLLVEFEDVDEEFYEARTGRIEAGGVYFYSDTTEYRFGLALKTAKTKDDLGTRNYTIASLPLQAVFDYRDDPLDATSGYYASIGMEPFLNISGTKTGLLSYTDLRTYRKVGERVTLAVRGQIGSIVGPSLENAPADFLFYSGGGGTVRGQPYQSLGVELSDDVTIGGRTFVGLSGEVRVATGGNLSVVGFYDAGYIGAESFYDGSGDWQSGAGAGVRYATGIGPIRVDVGFPVSGPGNNSGFEVYIGIGQSF